MDEVTIRKADWNDFKTIQKLDAGLFHNESQFDNSNLINMQWPYQYEGESFFRRMITTSDAVCFVAQARGEMIGFLTGSLLMIDSTRPIQRSQLINIYVDPKWRDKGTGKQLSEAFFTWSKEKGAKKILVMAYQANNRAIDFYKKLGFSPRHLTLEADVK